MSFTNGTIEAVVDLAEGEVIASSPHNIDAFDKFEDGLKVGHFAKLDTGSVDNLDGSATPLIIGVPKRKINKAIDSQVYNSVADINGLKDANADVATFGRITVAATSASVPTEGAPVFVINAAANPDNGKVTQNSGETGALAVVGAVFKEEKSSDVWVITIQNYLV